MCKPFHLSTIVRNYAFKLYTLHYLCHVEIKRNCNEDFFSFSNKWFVKIVESYREWASIFRWYYKSLSVLLKWHTWSWEYSGSIGSNNTACHVHWPFPSITLWGLPQPMPSWLQPTMAWQGWWSWHFPPLSLTCESIVCVACWTSRANQSQEQICGHYTAAK